MFLNGIRVLDLTNVLSGPFCCHQLAHMGAEVIKVERPQGGDLARQLGASPELSKQGMGVSFLAQNAGKKSITLDLKKDSDKEQFIKLVRESDVLVENFRPGVMKRLGLDFEVLKQENPQLIYCAISGFGQEGPLANLPAYDQIIQGMSGIMDITGSDTEHYRVGFPIADTVGGLTAAMVINAALCEKERKAHFIDVSMLDSVLATMGWAVSNLLVADKAPKALGNDNVTASPSGSFKTKDGLINIAANKQEQFESLCHILDLSELITDPSYSQRENRLLNRSALKQKIEERLQTNTTSFWWEKMVKQGVPSGPVYQVKEIIAHEQIQSRDMIEQFNIDELEQPLEILCSGYRVDGKTLKVGAPPPKLGEHNQVVFQSIDQED